MKYYLTLLFCLMLLYTRAQDIHVLSKIISTNRTASPDEMTMRISKAAVDYAKYTPIPRFAELDYAFGTNYDEFAKLGGFGVLYIPSLNRDTDEYPIKRVYFKSEGKIIELKKLGDVRVQIFDKQTRSTFGSNRVDYYYLLPYTLTQQSGELLIDWSKNRKQFVLSKFPDNNPINFLTINLKNLQKQPDYATLKAFLKREFAVNAD